MLIAIDYDNTYSSDPETFNKIIKLFQDTGHSVICVTGRTSEMGKPVLESIGKIIPVIFAGKEWKREAAKQAGYDVDIWIDDNPMSIDKQIIIGGGWVLD